ncbi:MULTISPECIES: nuclear transport factor 2 family protein [unclassified Mycobacterium]|uniref:nuclear transport factor 2 family protein n=1 Tax=unclassified Mycobacterium TaxID=2642494 RepID=UPI0029C6E0F3|nr:MULTISPECIES: nuclear transport factor 2 family protein [unclassified Mycobacterium]
MVSPSGEAVTEATFAEVQRVLVAYARAIDTKDWDLFTGLFDPDCAMTTALGTVNGAQALSRHMAVLHAPLDSSTHQITNIHVVEQQGGVTAHSYLDALLVRADHPRGPFFRVVGFYDDELRRAEHGMVIVNRRFTAIWREGNPAVLGAPDG